MAMENASPKTWEKDTRPIEVRYAEFKEKMTAHFREAHEKRQAFYQIDPKFVIGPVAAVKNSKGARMPFINENAAILMQAMLDKGIDDPRWISANQIKEMGAYVQKGQKGTVVPSYRGQPIRDDNNKIIGFEKSDKVTGLVTYFSVSQLSKKDQARIDPVSEGKMRDTIARNMADYLYKNISIDRDLSEQFAEASAQAHKAAQELDRSWAEKRIAAIDGVDLRAKPESLEMRLMQEAKKIRKKDPDIKNYIYRATVAVMKEGKYDDAAIEKALMKVSPEPTGLNFNNDYNQGYGRRIVEAAKDNPEVKRARRLATAR